MGERSNRPLPHCKPLDQRLTSVWILGTDVVDRVGTPATGNLGLTRVDLGLELTDRVPYPTRDRRTHGQPVLGDLGSRRDSTHFKDIQA